jgi:hypothetical protein
MPDLKPSWPLSLSPQTLSLALSLCLPLGAAANPSILFIGNSFTYGAHSSAQFYRTHSVTDLNLEGNGGLGALFKSFTQQAGLSYDVYLETHGGIGLDWHLANKAHVLTQRPWDSVVMHGFSTLDAEHPKDPSKLIDTSAKMAKLLASKNPNVSIHLMSTWSRADQTYTSAGAWYGSDIEKMGQDIRVAYDLALKNSPLIKDVIPVGEAFNQAIREGLADANPYDGIDAGKFNLWTFDHYHASAYGYYLEALVVFGAVTHRDPRSLGANECSGYELGLSQEEVMSMQRVAFDQVHDAFQVKANPLMVDLKFKPQHCQDP